MSEKPSLPPLEYFLDQYDVVRGHKKGLQSSVFLSPEDESDNSSSTMAILRAVKISLKDILNAQGPFAPRMRAYANWMNSALGRDAYAIRQFDRQNARRVLDSLASYQFAFVDGLGQGLLGSSNPLGVPLSLASGNYNPDMSRTILEKSEENASWASLLEKAKSVSDNSKIVVPGWGAKDSTSYEIKIGRSTTIPEIEHVTRNPQKNIWPISQMGDFEIAEKMIQP